MKGDLKRGFKSRQLKSGILCFKFDGTIATPVADGPDEFAIKQIVDLGAGNYTIILNEALEQDLHPLSILGDVAVGFKIQAVADDRITILCESAAGAAVDSVVHMTIATFDFRIRH
jgi:hypothetical protein